MPFWKADRGGRPVEMGRAIGRLTRELLAATRDEATERLQRDHDLDPLAAQNLLAYLEDQREATGVLPDDRTIVLERTRDEMGDWRLCLLSPWGGRVHAPWATALEARLRQAGEAEVESIWSDDGIVLRLPERERPPEAADLLPEPEEIEDLVVRELGGTSLFAARFREAAARALLLPAPPAGAADAALDAEEARPRPAAGGRALPVLPDRARGLPRVPARRLRPAGARGDRLARAAPRDPPRHRGHAGPVALLGVAPLRLRRQLPLRGRRAARRAARPGPGRGPGPAARAARRGGAAGAPRPPRPRRAGDRAPVPRRAPTRPRAPSGSTTCCCASATSRGRGGGPRAAARRTATPPRPRRPGSKRSSGSAGRSGSTSPARSAGPPPRTPGACATRSASPRRRASPPPSSSRRPHALRDVVSRYARTHGPFTAADVARRFATGEAPVLAALAELAKDGRVLEGEFRPGGSGREWCGADVLATLRRRSLAALRKQVEPAEPTALARLLADWQGVATAPATRRGPDALLDVVEQLQGAALPASILERDVLPARLPGYRPEDLDTLSAAGEVVWVGLGALGRSRRPPRALPGRRPPAPPAGRGPSRRRRRPRADPRAPRPPRGVLLRRDPRRGRGRARAAGAGRALGPGLGGRGHERHAGGAPRLPRGARGPGGAQTPRGELPLAPAGPALGRGPLEPAARRRAGPRAPPRG